MKTSRNFMTSMAIGLGVISVVLLTGCATSVPGESTGSSDPSSIPETGDSNGLPDGVLANLRPGCAQFPGLPALQGLIGPLTSASADDLNYGNPADNDQFGGFHIECSFSSKGSDIYAAITYEFHVDGYRYCDGGGAGDLASLGAVDDPAGVGVSSAYFGYEDKVLTYFTCTSDALVTLAAIAATDSPPGSLPEYTVLRDVMSSIVADEALFKEASKYIPYDGYSPTGNEPPCAEAETPYYEQSGYEQSDDEWTVIVNSSFSGDYQAAFDWATKVCGFSVGE